MNPLTEDDVKSLFQVARLPALRIWRLPNQYFTYQPEEDEETTRREAVYRESRPSWLVKTSAGLIQLNLRKRVLEIDWSDTQLQAKPGAADDVTKQEFLIHAYTMLKIAEYLTEISDAYLQKRKDL